jgi:type 1 glutamine amidotransferase
MRTLLLLIAFATTLAAAPKRVLIIGQGPDGHPPGTHEFMAGARVVEKLLGDLTEVKTTVTDATEPWTDGPKLLDEADAVVLLVTQGAMWMQADEARLAAFKRFAERKGGLVALHWSIGAKDAKFMPLQLSLLGGTRGGPQRKYIILENDVRRVAPKHPVLSGIADFRVKDEFYYRLELAKDMQPLLSTTIEGNEETVCWAFERKDGGRSFGYVGFHFHENWKREDYRRLVKQAVMWSLEIPVPEKGAPVAAAE